ncbi:hypothetical protein PRIPAC_80176, partial [Pristionchus pacificus]
MQISYEENKNVYGAFQLFFDNTNHIPYLHISKSRTVIMPGKGISRQSDRDCIVCGQTTRIAHLGIEVCRACAVFYRRAKRGNVFVCRSSTGQCLFGKGLNCKRCRLDRLVHLLGRAEPLKKAKGMVKASSPSVDSPFTKPKFDLPLLDRVKTHYNTMCFTRLSSELNSRSNPPHPLEINLEKGPFFPADFAALIRSVRMMITAALEFGNTTFPEFADLSDSEKWTLATTFFYRFRVFEGCSRANKYFPEKPDIYFVSYATYCRFPLDEEFLSTAPPGADVAGAVAFWKKSPMTDYLLSARELIARVKSSAEEFIVVVVLMFWTYGDMSISENIIRIGEKYRGLIEKELHAYYRDELKLDNYAARMGELMMIIQTFEKTRDLKEQFEVMRLFNIMTDDNFVY